MFLDKKDNIQSTQTEHGSYEYTYDDLYRLTNTDNPDFDDESYSYDNVGNRLTSADTTGSWAYNDNNELGGYDNVSYEYDPNGNMVRKTVGVVVTSYVYNVEDRLAEVWSGEAGTGSLTASYYYDPFGRRLWKDVGGVRTYFHYADEGLIGEFDSSGVEVKSYGYKPGSTFTTDPLFMKVGGDYYWFQNDHLGTPQKLTSVSGAIVWSARYNSFGKATIDIGTVENNLRFPGQYEDVETELHYNRFRYYDSKSGRYLRTDPIGLNGGINLFAYVKNNPIKLVDYMGLYCGSGPTDAIVPDSPYGFDFTNACIWHDNCYLTCGMTKGNCDRGFLERMRDVCRGYPSLYPIDQRAACMRVADSYYAAVFAGGHIPYRNAQRDSGCCNQNP